MNVKIIRVLSTRYVLKHLSITLSNNHKENSDENIIRALINDIVLLCKF